MLIVLCSICAAFDKSGKKLNPSCGVMSSPEATDISQRWERMADALVGGHAAFQGFQPLPKQLRRWNFLTFGCFLQTFPFFLAQSNVEYFFSSHSSAIDRDTIRHSSSLTQKTIPALLAAVRAWSRFP